MSPEEERLMRYIDGTSPPDEAAAVAADLARDPALRARVERWRRQSEALRAAFDPLLAEPPPQRLRDAARPAAIIPLRLPEAARRWARPLLAAAAALAIGFGLGLGVAPGGEAGFAAGLRADGALAAALDRTPSGRERDEVRVLFTVADAGGARCRGFAVEGHGGLACASPGAPWRVVAFAPTPARPAGDYRPASGPPEAVLEALVARGAGDPLDPEAEAALIARGWR